MRRTSSARGKLTCISREFSRFLGELVETGEIPFRISRDPRLRGAGVDKELASSETGLRGGTWPIPIDPDFPWTTTTLSVDADLKDKVSDILLDMGLTMSSAASMFLMQCLFEMRTYPTNEPWPDWEDAATK